MRLDMHSDSTGSSPICRGVITYNLFWLIIRDITNRRVGIFNLRINVRLDKIV